MGEATHMRATWDTCTRAQEEAAASKKAADDATEKQQQVRLLVLFCGMQ